MARQWTSMVLPGEGVYRLGVLVLSGGTFEIVEGDALVGTLGFESHGVRHVGRFNYADTWVSNESGYALEPGLPLEVNEVFFSDPEDPRSSLPLFLLDTAPDSWGRRVLRRAIGGGCSELDYLVSVPDAVRIGSLSLRSAALKPPVRPLASSRDLLELQRLVDRFEAQEPIDASGMDFLAANGTALGGARPKCSVTDGDQVSVVKFTSLNDRSNVETAEVLALSLAARCGILAAEARLVRIEGRPAAVLRRFDRNGSERVGYMSARTMLGLRDAAAGNYVDLADAIRAHAPDPVTETHELFRRIAFGILVSNTDDHMKNHGFLHAGDGRWRLAPAFDVNPAPERHRQLKTAISAISGHAADIDILVDHAPFFDLNTDEASRIVGGIAETIDRQWRELGAQLGMTGKDIAHYRPAFEHAEMNKALRFSGRGHAPRHL